MADFELPSDVNARLAESDQPEQEPPPLVEQPPVEPAPEPEPPAQQANPMQSAYEKVASLDPEQSRKLLAVAEKLGYTPSYVEQNFKEASAAAGAPSPDYFDHVQKNFPITAKHLSDPATMAVAKDDIENLIKHEHWFKELSLSRSLGRALMSGSAQMAASATRLPALAEMYALAPYNSTAALLGLQQASVKELLDNPISNYFDKQAALWQSPDAGIDVIDAAKRRDYHAAGRSLAANFAQNFPNQALTIALAVSGAGPAGLIALSALEGASAAKQASDAGVSPNRVALNATGHAVAEGGFEHLGTFQIIEHLGQSLYRHAGKEGARQIMKKMLLTLGFSALGEGLEEAPTQIAQDLTDWATGVNPNALQGLGHRAAIAGIHGAVSGGAMTGPAAVWVGARKATFGGSFREIGPQELHVVGPMKANAQVSVEFLKQIAESAEASKLRASYPSAYSTWVNTVTRGSEIENIYLDPAAAESYFQSAKIDPNKVMDELGSSARFVEAKKNGTKVAIPLAKFLERFAHTPHIEGLAEHASFDESMPSLAEVKTIQTLSKKIADRIQKEADGALEKGVATKEQRQDIEQRFESYLTTAFNWQGVPARVTEEVVKAEAKRRTNIVLARAARRGITIEKSYSKEARYFRGIGSEGEREWARKYQELRATPPSALEAGPKSDQALQQGDAEGPARKSKGLSASDPSVTGHPVFVKALSEAAPVLAQHGIDSTNADAVIGLYRDLHGKIHEAFAEARKTGDKARQAELSKQMTDLGMQEKAVIRLANIMHSPEQWLEFYERRDRGDFEGGAPKDVMRQNGKDWVTPIPMETQTANPLSPYVKIEGIDGAAGRLTRFLERAVQIGSPSNKRTVFKKDGKTFAVGRITTEDWVKRVESELSKEEITKARSWYGDLHKLMAEIFGDEHADRYALAWLLSQQNTSPSGGMLNVLRAANEVMGLPKVKEAGLNANNLKLVLAGELPKSGFGAKLLDFIDSELQRPVRAVMGDDPRGLTPAVIDLWGNRDIGKVDSRVRQFVKDTFGADAARRLKIDGDGISETDYEYGVRFYNDLTDTLNRHGYDGGGWKAYEAQAVGWVAMQKAMGDSPEFPADIVAKNTRRMSIGLTTHDGTRVIQPSEAMRVIHNAAEAAGATVRSIHVSHGAYQGSFEGAVQVDVIGSPESFQDMAAIVGHALKQTEVIVTRPLASGRSRGYTIVEQEGGVLGTTKGADDFVKRVRAILDEKVGKDGHTIADGFAIIAVDGKSSLLFLHGEFNEKTGRVEWRGNWNGKERRAFEDAVGQAAEEFNLGVDLHFDPFDVVSEFNDWRAHPRGEAYRDSLKERRRSKLAARLGVDDELRLLPDSLRPASEGRGGEGSRAAGGRRADRSQAPERQGRLAQLPDSSPGPIHLIRDAVIRFARLLGVDPRSQAHYALVDEERARRIAQAFDEMKHDPENPEVKAAYEALISETLAQYQFVKRMGLKIERAPKGFDPYPQGPKQVHEDLRRGHLWYFATEDGFGQGEELPGNPMLRETGETLGGHKLLANDVFRIVHDVFGHGKEGFAFGPQGEENAWQSHVRMYSPLAAQAMTTETRGQNSWVNYGPHGEANRSNKSKTIYAPQKIGLLPSWVMTEGRVEDGDVLRQELPYQPPFFSQLERTVMKKMGNSGTVEQVRAMAREAKQDEVEWLGLEDYLKGKDKVNKEDLLSFIRANQLQVKEVWKGDTSTDAVEERMTQIVDEVRQEQFDGAWPDREVTVFERPAQIRSGTLDQADSQERSGWILYQNDSPVRWDGKKLVRGSGTQIFSSEEEARAAADAANRHERDVVWEEISNEPLDMETIREQAAVDVGADTKYGPDSQYNDLVKPNAKGYREILFVIPRDFSAKLAEAEQKVRDAFRDNPQEAAKLNDLNYVKESYELGWGRAFDKNETSIEDFRVAGIEDGAIGRAYKELNDLRLSTPENFRSGHWDEENVFAHVRISEREDTLQRRFIYIEEAQSDWHHAGRKKGYLTKEARAQREAYREARTKLSSERRSIATDRSLLYESLSHKWNDNWLKSLDVQERRSWIESQPEMVALRAKIDDLTNQIEKLDAEAPNDDALPDAPFKTSWQDLVMKRMMRYAAENGFDGIAWITGRDSAERYNVGNQIKSLHYEKITDSPYRDYLNKNGYQAIHLDRPLPDAVREHLRKMYEDSKDFKPAYDEYAVWAIDKHGDRVEIGRHNAARLPEVVGKELADKIIAGEGEAHTRDRQAVTLEKNNEAGRYYVVKWDDTGEVIASGIQTIEEADKIADKAEANGAQDTGVRTLSGLDLHVGGGFHKQLYDKMIPSFMKKFVKKWKADVGSVRFDEVSDLVYGVKADTIGWLVNKPGGALVEFRDLPEEFQREINQSRRDRGVNELPSDSYTIAQFPTRARAEDAASLLSSQNPTQNGFDAHAVVFTDELTRAAMHEGFPLFQQANDPRGEFVRSMNLIRLFEAADPSTLVHESAHAWLEEFFNHVKSGQANEADLKDFEVLKKWLKITDEQTTLTREQHEHFARANELYHFEAKAPTPEQKQVFKRFGKWLTDIYGTLKERSQYFEGVQMSSETRGFMDRMYATQEEITNARTEMGESVVDEIPDLEPATAQQVKTLEQKARDIAEDIILKEELADAKQAAAEAANRQREELTTQTEESLQANPLYEAIDSLRRTFGLERDSFSERPVISAAERFLAGTLDEKEKAAFEIAAEQFGYADGQDLARRVAQAKPLDRAVQDIVDAKMKRFAVDPAKLKELARKAVLNERMVDLLALEQQVLEELHRDKEVRAEVSARRRALASAEARSAREEAKAILAGKSVKEATAFRKYFNAARKAAVEVAKAMATKDYAAAANAKRQQMVAAAMASEAIRNSTEAKRITKFLSKFAARRNDLMGMPYGFVRQIDGLLARFGLANPRTEDLKTLSEIAVKMASEQSDAGEIANATGLVLKNNQWVPESLDEMVMRANEDYHPMVLPPGVQGDDVLRQNGNVTMQQLRDVRLAIQAISEVGRGYDNFLSFDSKVTIKAAAAEIRKSIAAKIGTPYAAQMGLGSPDEKGKVAKVIDSILNLPDTMAPNLVNILTLSRYLDGGEDNGPVTRLVYRVIKAAEDRKLKRYEKTVKEVGALFSKYYTPEELAKYKDQRFKFQFGPGFERTFTREEILVMALNWGNEGNRDRVRNGFLHNGMPVQIEDLQVQAILDVLDKKDWDFAQDVWDHLQSYWPDIVALEQKVSGATPVGVQPSAVNTRYGSYRGGYFPIAYDPSKSAESFKHQIEKNALYKEFSASAAHTEHGHTQARVQTLGRPIKLSMSVLFDHLENVIHDLEFRAAVIDVNSLLHQKDTKAAITFALGPGGARAYEQWLKAVASDQRDFLSDADQYFRWFRFRSTFATLAYRAFTMPMDLTGNTINTIWEIGVQRMASAVSGFAAAPHETVAMVNGKSERMRSRATLRDRDIMDMAKKWEGRDSVVKQFGFYFQSLADEALSYPLWAETYQHALSKYGDEKTAINIADEAVTMTMGSGSVLDQVQAQRGSEGSKILSMYFSWLSMMFNRAWLGGKIAGLQGRQGDRAAMVMTLAKTAFFAWGLQGLNEFFWRELFRNAPGDDEEERKRRFYATMLKQPFGYMWVVRDLAGFVIDQGLQGKRGASYRFSPLEQSIEDSLRPLGQGLAILTDSGKEFDQRYAESVARSGAVWAGYPQKANDITFNFIDWMNGQGELTWRDLFNRRVKK